MDGKLGILDSRVLFTKGGVVLNEETNPMYTIDGLKVNLAYKNHKKFGKWIVVLLKKGDSPLALIKKQFYLLIGVNGQYVTSYYLETLLGHNGRLCLDTWYVYELVKTI